MYKQVCTAVLQPSALIRGQHVFYQKWAVTNTRRLLVCVTWAKGESEWTGNAEDDAIPPADISP